MAGGNARRAGSTVALATCGVSDRLDAPSARRRAPRLRPPASRRAAFEPLARFEPLEGRTLLSSAAPASAPPLSALSGLTASPDVTVYKSYNGYWPQLIQQVYGYTSVKMPGGNGAGQTIAIVDPYSDSHIQPDLATFDQKFGIQPATLQIVNQTGGPQQPAGNTSWGEEISLDVEYAHAMAPAANILLVEAANASLSNLLAAVNYARDVAGVSVVSMSWGDSEFSTEGSYDSYFTTPAGHQGVTFVAASGDTGTSGGLDWPAASSHVLSVGGTTLSPTDTGYYGSETAWSGTTAGGSHYEGEPTYQKKVQTTGARGDVDVAYSANPSQTTGYWLYDTYNVGGWFVGGGTSAGAPQWAAIVAIADQGRAAAKLGTLDGFSGTLPALYSVYGTSKYSSTFYDITSGSAGSLAAKTGYDDATGLGTPRVAGVVSWIDQSRDRSRRRRARRIGRSRHRTCFGRRKRPDHTRPGRDFPDQCRRRGKRFLQDQRRCRSQPHRGFGKRHNPPGGDARFEHHRRLIIRRGFTTSAARRRFGIRRNGHRVARTMDIAANFPSGLRRSDRSR
jgi:hypothetical protein